MKSGASRSSDLANSRSLILTEHGRQGLWTRHVVCSGARGTEKAGLDQTETRPKGWLSRPAVKRISPLRKMSPIVFVSSQLWVSHRATQLLTPPSMSPIHPQPVGGVHVGPVCVTRPVRLVRFLLICFSFPHIGVCLRPDLAALGCWSTAV